MYVGIAGEGSLEIYRRGLPAAKVPADVSCPLVVLGLNRLKDLHFLGPLSPGNV